MFTKISIFSSVLVLILGLSMLSFGTFARGDGDRGEGRPHGHYQHRHHDGRYYERDEVIVHSAPTIQLNIRQITLESNAWTKYQSQEVSYVIHYCSYFDCALVVRVGFVVHNGRVYSPPTCYCRYRYNFSTHQWPESLVSVGQRRIEKCR